MNYRIDNLQYCKWSREIFEINNKAGLNAVHVTLVYHEDYDELQQSIDAKDVHLIPFSDEMGTLYSAADLIVSRAGALALSEMALMGKAMVLIPFPHAAGDHQVKNALAFSNSGAAVILPQFQLKSGDLETTVLELFQQPDKIKGMEEKSIQMAAPDAISKIISTIMEIAES